MIPGVASANAIEASATGCSTARRAASIPAIAHTAFAARHDDVAAITPRVWCEFRDAVCQNYRAVVYVQTVLVQHGRIERAGQPEYVHDTREQAKQTAESLGNAAYSPGSNRAFALFATCISNEQSLGSNGSDRTGLYSSAAADVSAAAAASADCWSRQPRQPRSRLPRHRPRHDVA